MPTLTTAGSNPTELSYSDTQGIGRPVVLIHGWPASPQSWQAISAALQEAGRHAGPNRPLAHFSMEGDGGEGTALRLRLWSGGPPRTWHLGRADFHGRWIEWQAQEES